LRSLDLALITRCSVAAALQSMIPKKPAPDLIRGGNRFLDKIMLKRKI
jgi:hypothetical protein